MLLLYLPINTLTPDPYLEIGYNQSSLSLNNSGYEIVSPSAIFTSTLYKSQIYIISFNYLISFLKWI